MQDNQGLRERGLPGLVPALGRHFDSEEDRGEAHALQACSVPGQVEGGKAWHVAGTFQKSGVSGYRAASIEQVLARTKRDIRLILIQSLYISFIKLFSPVTVCLKLPLGWGWGVGSIHQSIWRARKEISMSPRTTGLKEWLS